MSQTSKNGKRVYTKPNGFLNTSEVRFLKDLTDWYEDYSPSFESEFSEI